MKQICPCINKPEVEENLARPNSQDLQEYKYGICLTNQHARWIWEGKKELIVKSLEHKNLEGKIVYLLSEGIAYGLIKIGEISHINLTDFENLEKKHLILSAEREKRWKDKEILFSYPFEIIKIFNPPRKAILPKDTTLFIENFELTDKPIISKTMKLNRVSGKNLMFIHNLLHGMWEIMKTKKVIEWTKRDVLNLHNRVTYEMKEKDIKHQLRNELDNVNVVYNLSVTFTENYYPLKSVRFIKKHTVIYYDVDKLAVDLFGG